MAVPMLDLPIQNRAMRGEVMAALEPILDGSRFVLGEAVELFEQALADSCGVKHAIGVSSGTDALLVALLAFDLGPGDEVIVPAFTFFATAGMVHRVGATPVFVDIDPLTYNIDAAATEAAITDRTRAIIPVHLYGQCAAMDPLLALARKHDLIVIEDAAQAIGALDDGRPAGSMGQIGCLSFYPTKNLGAWGDAGAVLCNDADLAEKIRCLRLHGQTDAYRHRYVGGNFRIDAIQATVLRVKLGRLHDYAAARGRLACRYHGLLSDLPLDLPTVAERNYHVFNQYTIASDRRDALCEHLAAHQIGHKVFYPLPLHLQPCFVHLGYREGQLPQAERAAARVVSLPMYPELSEAQQDETADAIRSFFI